MYKQRGAFIIEWSMAIPFYLICLFCLIVICLWFSSISMAMFTLNETARFATREVFNPSSNNYQSSPQDVFDKKIKDWAKSPPLLINNVSYSTDFYSDLNGVISGETTEYDRNKSKIVSYKLKMNLNPLSSFFPVDINFNTHVLYSLYDNEDEGVLIK